MQGSRIWLASRQSIVTTWSLVGQAYWLMNKDLYIIGCRNGCTCKGSINIVLLILHNTLYNNNTDYITPFVETTLLQYCCYRHYFHSHTFHHSLDVTNGIHWACCSVTGDHGLCVRYVSCFSWMDNDKRRRQSEHFAYQRDSQTHSEFYFCSVNKRENTWKTVFSIGYVYKYRPTDGRKDGLKDGRKYIDRTGLILVGFGKQVAHFVAISFEFPSSIIIIWYTRNPIG